MNELLRSKHGRTVILLILLGITFHLAYSTHLELVGDEAYYWLWSRHPDFCYLDKGPMIAWLIAAGTALFGQTVFGVRFFAVLLAGGTGFGMFLLARQLFSDRVGLWTVVVATVAPLFAVGASLMTIDTVYVFFWTWAAVAFWRAKDESRLAPWALTGALVGLGMLSKYTAAIELISFALFCLWHAPSRSHLRRPTFWTMLMTALLFLVPAVVWNVQHGWPTSDWLRHRGALDERFALNLSSILVFVGEQAGVISPLFFVGLVFILFRRPLARTAQPGTGYALALFLPLFVIYLALSFHYQGPPNWAAAAYVGGFILLTAKWTELMRTQRWAWWAGVAALAFASIETVILLETRWLHLRRGIDPLDRARGSRSLAASVALTEQRTGAQFVIADNYMTAALLSFYLPGQPETFVPITTRPLNQLDVWPTYEQKHPTGDALVIAKRQRLSRSLQARFALVEPLGSIEAVDCGRKVALYRLFLCRRAARGAVP
jgi:4-amino-4-deoxy-L-arabinose transferase-like glycosyltransferase